MLKLPLVSFIVTSFNYEKYLLKTLESIVAQSYENIEIIIVDDASSDKSVEIAENFISVNQDKRITLIRHKKNLGQLAAIQTGLKKAQGEFVCFIDSDDVLLPDYAKIHIRVHMAASVAFTSCEIVEINQNDEIMTMYSPASPHRKPHYKVKNLNDLLVVDNEHPDFKLVRSRKFNFGGWFWSPNGSAMFRKSVVEMMLLYKNSDKWKICPDKFLFNMANLVGGSATIFVPLLAYRRHGGNAGAGGAICGDTKYNNDKTTAVNIKNNIKIRPEAIKFILSNRKYFCEKFGKRATTKFIVKILLSYLYVLKQAATRG